MGVPSEPFPTTPFPEPPPVHAVVGHEDEDGVVHELPFIELGLKSAHVFVDVLDHAVEAGGLCLEAKISEALGVGRRSNERSVRRVGGDVGEEGLVLVFRFLDPAHGGGEEEVGTVAFGFHEGTVVADDGVKVFVLRSVGAGAVVGLPNSTRSVNEDFVEAALVGLVFFFVAEVPLAENAGSVSGGFKDLWKNGGVESHALALENGVGDAILHGVPTGHDACAGGRTSWADEETGKARALFVVLVEIGCLDPGVAMFPDGSIALVVGHDEDDVGLLGCESRACESEE